MTLTILFYLNTGHPESVWRGSNQTVPHIVAVNVQLYDVLLDIMERSTRPAASTLKKRENSSFYTLCVIILKLKERSKKERRKENKVLQSK